METDKLRVIHCSYCDCFKELPEGTVLHYPRDKSEISKVEFVIIECVDCKKPVVIYGEHITELSKEAYGRILYKCKSLFGTTIKIGNKHKILSDHWCLHVLS